MFEAAIHSLLDRNTQSARPFFLESVRQFWLVISEYCLAEKKSLASDSLACARKSASEDKQKYAAQNYNFCILA